jgi:uridine kinase
LNPLPSPFSTRNSSPSHPLQNKSKKTRPNQFVKPAFDRHIAPSRRHADVIVPWTGGDNEVAVALIADHIARKLARHDLVRFPLFFCAA